jgi:serine/threonine-protein kinase
MAAADRDLLFGLLALQNGLIGQVELVATFQAWTLDKGRPLAEHLVAMGHLDAADRDALGALVARHLKKHGGSTEQSLAAIPAGPSTCASLARLGDPDVEATLSHLAGSGPSTRDGHVEAGPTVSYAVGTVTSEGQRFRVLRPHARGGLGAVFVALDTELHREVALKQILDRYADDPISCARFLLEAEITGALEHPGIVPVYGLGTSADGRPYYAMRLVRGDSLKEAIERFHSDQGLQADLGRRSLELRKLLRRFIEVCNPIDYAHSRGILHRDIKPANVIVGRYGETLVVDWGLAKALGRSEPGSNGAEETLRPSSASGSSETLPGSALGSPAYMSPEQAEGQLDRLGPRSDVYSLGATLYCLLTGKPPFAGEVADVIRAVQRGEFQRPRHRDATIDPALEAVCLKAMALQPVDRYPTPRALAEDIERWMADEPVFAWREPTSRHVRRWARRNRTAVSAAMAAMLAGVVGLAAVLANQTRANRELAGANAELARSRSTMQARYDLAVEAIKTFHTGVSEDFLLKEDRFKELRDRLLKSASDFYGKLGALLGRESDPASRRALASANFEVAELTATVGRAEDALAEHRKVLAAREALAAESGANEEAIADVGRSLTAIGVLNEATGRATEAEADYRAAVAIRQKLVDDHPAVVAFRDALALSHKHLGFLLSNTGKVSEAEAEYRDALAIQRRLVDDHPAVAVYRDTLGRSHNNLGLVLENTGRRTEAEAEYRTALAIKQKLADDNPAVTGFRRSLASTHINLGNLLADTGRGSEAEAQYRAGLAIQRKLVDDHPSVGDFRHILARSHNNLGLLLANTGRRSEAEAESRAAVAIKENLVRDNPTVTGFRADLAGSHANLGNLLADAGRASDAEAEYRTALDIQRKLVVDNPTVTDFRNNLAISHQLLGSLLSNMGRTSEGEAEHRAAVAILRRPVDENPRVTAFCDVLARSHNNLGSLLEAVDRLPEAEAEYREALAIYRKLVDDNPAVTSYRGNLAVAAVNLVSIQTALGRDFEARAGADRAVALLESVLEQEPRSVFYRSALGGALLRRGQARRAGGDLARALSDWRHAVSIFEAMPPSEPQFAYLEACCHAMLAEAAGRDGPGGAAAGGRSEADRAMDRLRRAVGMGYGNLGEFRTDPALAPLRDRDDFRLLLMDLAMPSQPFAR